MSAVTARAADAPGAQELPENVHAPAGSSIRIEFEEGARNIYRTSHFRLVSDVPLTGEVLDHVASIFEGTREAVRALPLGLKLKEHREAKTARLFATRRGYEAAGGVRGTTGLYNPATREILVPLQGAGVLLINGRLQVDEEVEPSALVHELVHQVMHPWLTRMPVWLAEGLAMYIESVPYEDGTFFFSEHDLLGFLADRGERNLNLYPLDRLVSDDYASWGAEVVAPDKAGLIDKYHTALILTYYFLHLDPTGQTLFTYLNARQAGLPEATAQLVLFHGKSPRQFRMQIVEAVLREHYAKK